MVITDIPEVKMHFPIFNLITTAPADLPKPTTDKITDIPEVKIQFPIFNLITTAPAVLPKPTTDILKPTSEYSLFFEDVKSSEIKTSSPYPHIVQSNLFDLDLDLEDALRDFF